jgi:DNA-binding NarL/FixJ family response regulator
VCSSDLVRGRPTSQPTRCVILDAEPASPGLSNREREVLIHLAKGLSAKQAAAALGICAKTVDNHAQRLMRKLDLHSRADVVRFAIRDGYVTA